MSHSPSPAAAGRPWYLATLGGLASYLDSGVLFATALSISLWQGQFGLSAWSVGAITAALTVSIGIGSLVGGHVGDRFGRKRVYSADLIVFAFGLLWLIFAANEPMLYVGVVLTGLAAGADLPASLALVGESAPAAKRGRMVSYAQLMWGLGIIVVQVVAKLTAFSGTLMPRILFGQLLLVALVTWALRQRLPESEVWVAERERRNGKKDRSWALLMRLPILGGLAFTTAFYLLSTVMTQFFGNFGPYAMISLFHFDLPTVTSIMVMIGPVGLVCGIVFMRLVDHRTARTAMFAVGAVVQLAGLLLLVVLPLDATVFVICFMVVIAGASFAGEGNYKVWSQEIFPTSLRGTAQGISFGIARIGAAAFTVVSPTLLHNDPKIVLTILLVATTVAMGLGFLFQPRDSGRTIEQIDAAFAPGPMERHSAGEATREHPTTAEQTT
ncbi:MFS transporter [Streptomyces glycanivorans]|uniref:MFS transporter n=1 Tax=Streptomyces glycanivorans TaxID=3033808 RepID=A0ABY9J840_9ACTN|nr:MFS transporter [Streptomyces sp. Alt3]WLQ63024.1 MFS transporter [Streptomyces sp. Alt3]